MSEVIGGVLLGAGLLVLAVAGLGLLRLPDALSRQHAATKAGTLGLALILPGVALAAGRPDWFYRLAALALILLATLPVAGHALARLARAESNEVEDGQEKEKAGEEKIRTGA